MSSPTIYIIDVTNRDGVQTAKLGLAKIEKTMINLYLNELGMAVANSVAGAKGAIDGGVDAYINNVLKQKPLVADEVRFIAAHPEQARKLMTLTP